VGIVDGRVVIVTGAGSGLGRAHARAFGAEGAAVVVNDFDADAAAAVADEIASEGGTAVAAAGDVSDVDAVGVMVRETVERFGGLDVVVNNAGIVRDRMVVGITAADWDAVMAVHLRGTFATMHHAANWWRAQSKAGARVTGRIVNTSSGAGLFGSVGQANYAAAKAGIAALTLVAAAELARYGVTVNAIAPSARTAMTETVFAEMMAKPATGFDRMDPANVSPLVVWLGSEGAGHVTGQMFEVDGGRICVAVGWTRGPEIDGGARWDPVDIGPVVDKLLAAAPTAVPVYGA